MNGELGVGGGGGRREVGVINFIFVFLLPPLRAGATVQSGRKGSLVCGCPFSARRSPEGRAGGGVCANESLKILMSYRESSRNTKQADRDAPSPGGASRRSAAVDCLLTARQTVTVCVCLFPPRCTVLPPPQSHPHPPLPFSSPFSFLSQNIFSKKNK